MKRTKEIFTALFLATIIGLGIFAYNADQIYMVGKKNISMYLPDRLIQGADNKMILSLTDSMGQPLPNRDVKVSIRTPGITRTVFIGKTDSVGTASPVFSIDKTNAERAEILVECDGEIFSKKVVLDDKVYIYVTTDKPIYQPRQTIHTRAVAFEDYNATHKNITFTIYDPDGNKIFKKNTTPNEFGIASFDYELSDILPLGNYKITATLMEKTVQKSVLVKRYVLPKFEINTDGLKSYYTIYDNLKGNITVKYFFGKIVDGAVNIDVISYFGIWQKVKSTKGVLEDGKFSFDLGQIGYAVGLPYNAMNGYIELNISVTDTAGHMENKSYVLPIAREPIIPTIIADTNFPGQESHYYLIARYPDGKVVDNAKVEYYTYGSSYNSYVKKTTYTDTRGVAKLNFIYDSSESGLRIAVSKDQLSSEKYVSLKQNGLKIISDKSLYSIGDVAKFDFYYRGDAVTNRLFYDVISRGFVLTTGRVELIDGYAQIQLPITSDIKGQASLRAYKNQKNLDVVSDTLTFVVGGSDSIKMNITADKEIYTPRDEATIYFDVNAERAKMPVALGVSIVDKSVFELSERFTGFEKIYQGLEEEFVTPQYQIISYLFENTTVLPSTLVAYQEKTSSAGYFYTNGALIKSGAQSFKDSLISGYWNVLFLMLCGIYVLLFILAIKYKIAFVVVVVIFVIVSAVVLPAILYVWASGLASTGGSAPPTIQDVSTTNSAPMESQKSSGVSVTPDFLSNIGKTKQSQTSSERQYVEIPEEARTYFPETWYWNPTIITDENGKANITLTVPDTITTWEVDAVASTKNAEFATSSKNITVFKKFFVEPDIPVSAILNDTFQLRILIYNYQNSTSNVTVSLKTDAWFDLLSNRVVTTTVPPNSVTNVTYNITAKMVGKFNVSVSANSGMLSDSVVREIRIEPGGKEFESIQNNILENNGTVIIGANFSAQRINGSEVAYLKIQPSMTSVVVDGADKFIQFVSGCGEQSTSRLSVDIAAYKNLAKKNLTDEQLFKFENTINQGIQHELIYLKDDSESGGKAITWHGPKEPGDVWLTAWALFVFADLESEGFQIDHGIIEGMQKFITSKQEKDGSFSFPNIGHWSLNKNLLNEKVASTSYVTYALLYSGADKESGAIKSAVNYIQDNKKNNDTAYLNAISLLALSAAGGSTGSINQITAQLVAQANIDNINHTACWGWRIEYSRYYYQDNTIETTAYAMLALDKVGGYNAIVEGGVNYLLKNRRNGIFGSTHDTAVAFMALNNVGSIRVEYMDIEIYSNGTLQKYIAINESTRDLTHYIDLVNLITGNQLTITIITNGSGRVSYQLVTKYSVPWKNYVAPESPLSIEIVYDTTNITVGDYITANVELVYRGPSSVLKMVLIDLRAPVGFSFFDGDFDDAKDKGTISDYQIIGRQAQVYVDNVQKDVPVKFEYKLYAQYPIRATITGINAFDMYNPTLKTDVPPTMISAR